MAGEPESLDTDESLARRTHRHWFDRLIMLSDGVFAIAITLLAFDVRASVPATGGLPALWASLAPQLDAFALSFVAISAYWLAHRRFMAAVITVDAPFTVLNLLVLALVALVPAATKLTHGHGGAEPTMIVYAGLIAAIGAAMALLWGYAALACRLVSAEVPTGVRWLVAILILITPPLFLAIVSLIPRPGPGVVPLSLLALFLIGWRLRR
ncbi:MAG: DUF1211 domain-containing protein, partial [Caulobacteraceae bacterium]|nr:DUF1211 domain-containing protein [Caulobacteraceae bacterium]